VKIAASSLSLFRQECMCTLLASTNVYIYIHLKQTHAINLRRSLRRVRVVRRLLSARRGSNLSFFMSGLRWEIGGFSGAEQQQQHAFHGRKQIARRNTVELPLGV
jgi:hypothetical protein